MGFELLEFELRHRVVNSLSAPAVRMGLVALLSACAAGGVSAATSSPGGAIYSCIDAQGRKFTSDRPIAECSTREQRVHNSDGSVKQVVPPSMTADERTEAEAKERLRISELATQADAARRDRNIKARYPDEAKHQKARETALDDVRAATRNSEARLRELAAERKPLLDEAEFYKGKAMPAKLKQQIESNEVATQAQRELIANQQAEFERINALFDAELRRLKRLWVGALPGTLGGLPPAQASSAASSAEKAIDKPGDKKALAKPANKAADKH